MKRTATILGLAGAIAVLCAVALAHRLDARRGSGAAESSEPLTPNSVYQLSSRWTADDDHVLQLNELQGQFRIVALIFTSCPAACPTLVKELLKLDSQLPARLREKTKFTLISIDPERDTTAALRQYRDKMGLGRERWTLLRGNAADVRELAATLGFNYRQTQTADFVHSKLVTLLNPRGEIIFQQAGVATDTERLIGALDQARAR